MRRNRNAEKRAWRNAKRARGECVRCPRPARPNLSMCEEHAREANDYSMGVYYDRRRAHVCVRCEASVENGGMDCREHAEERRARTSKRRAA